jgi:AcrR family transcriptional regulator
MNEVGLGLRERKKQRTRQALIDAAMRLYHERGFDGVTVAEIAREADVAKEDVFLGRSDERVERLAQAIRERDRGTPILTAVRELLRTRAASGEGSATGTPGRAELLRHPAIANRLRQRWNRWEDVLAQAIAADVGAGPDDPEPRVVAAALTGAIRVAAAAGDEQPRRRDEIAERVFDLLASGLSNYGARSRPR